MRIAINTRFLLPDRMEGIGFFTQEVCRGLVARWPEHQFLFCFDRPFDQQFIFGPNVTGKAIFPPARDPILWKSWFEWRLPAVLKRWKADVFLSPDGYCSLKSKVPTVMVTHDIAHLHYPEQIPPRVRRYYDKHVPLFIERAEAVVTVSEFVKRDIIQQYGTDPAKISVACNGIKPGFEPIAQQEQEKVRKLFTHGQAYFFYLGAVHPRKNVPRLIQAYDTYRKQGGKPIKLLLGGRLAWQTTETQAAQEAAQFSDDIHFLGYLNNDDLPRLLGSALALIYPSLSEGFGVPLLEAMYVEVPIITSNATSLPEVAGPAAILVNPTQIDELVAAMHRISTDAALRAELVQKGRVQREKFSWDLATAVVAKAIEQIV